MALFRVDFSGRGELADRQQKLAQMLSRLQKISEGANYLPQEIAGSTLFEWANYRYPACMCIAGASDRLIVSIYIIYDIVIFKIEEMPTCIRLQVSL